MKKHLGKKVLASVMAGAMLFGTVAAGTMAFAADAGELKVAAISDINYKAGQADAEGMFLAKSAEALDAAIANIKLSDAEAVLVTGNLTYDGSDASHTYVAGKLAEIEAAGKQVYVIPGENDVKEGGVNAAAISKADFATKYADYGYTEAAAKDTATASYTAAPKAGFKLLMLDSVAANGTGAIAKDWAVAQAAGSDKVVAASHHPSVSRGSAEATLIGLVWEVAKVSDANGNPLFTGDAFEGLDIVDKSAFAYSDMEALYAAGVTDIFTGHALMNNVMTETVTDEAGVTTDTWTDYNCGSLVSAACGVRYATVTASATASTFSFIETVAGLNVQNKLAYDALRAYAFTYVDEVVAMAKPVINRVLVIAQTVANGFISTMDLGGIASILNGVVRGALKNLVADVMAILQDTTKLNPVIDDIVAGLKAAQVPTGETTSVSMQYALTDMMRQRQVNNQVVCTSFAPLVSQLKAATPGEDNHYPAAQTTLAQKLVQNVAGAINADRLMALLNEVMDQNLSMLGTSHNIRALLNGPVKYLVATVDLWSIVDGLITTNPDGTAVPDWAKPSALYKDLVKDILIGANGSAQSAAGLKSKVSDHAADLVDRFLIIGGAYVI